MCSVSVSTLISVFPLLSVYAYQAYNHYERGESLYIHQPKKELSTAENILRLLRPDKKYTALEAEILDIALILIWSMAVVITLLLLHMWFPLPGQIRILRSRQH